jgi:two-component system, OmpR family, alkaline phosphatase synthesis response regulator PhoP
MCDARNDIKRSGSRVTHAYGHKGRENTIWSDLMATHILVIDDYEYLLYLLRSILEEEHYRVSVINRGEGAHELIQESPPDLIILDLKLGDASGMDILEALRSHETTASIPVLVYTAAILEAESVRQLLAGNPERYHNVSMLRKPFDVDVLLQRVKHLIAAS